MKGRIGLRITSSILFLFSFILFLSGCILQRRSMHTLEHYYDTMPLPETHPLAIEKKRRKTQAENPTPSSESKSYNHGGGIQRILSTSQRQRGAQDLRWEQRQQQLEMELQREMERYKTVGYVQLVDDFTTVCSAVLMFNDLDRLRSKASRILIYPESWDMQLEISESQQKEAQKILAVQEKTLNNKRKQKNTKKSSKRKNNKKGDTAKLSDEEATNPLDPPPLPHQISADKSPQYHTARRLLHLARIKHSAILLPMPDDIVDPLVMLNMTDYKRLVYLRSPAVIMKNMDEMLLHSPVATVSAPRDSSGGLSSNFLMVTPENGELEYVMKQEGAISKDFGGLGKLVNKIYATTAMILPRWPHEIFTSDFFNSPVESNGNRASNWKPSKVLKEAYYIFFDAGKKTKNGEWEKGPQPWKLKSLEEDVAPKCQMVQETGNGEERLDCTARDVWKTLYDGYRQRRMEVCGLDLEA
ncbi:N-acetylglucosaminyltransferase [Orbilia oligospora]|nr:N-acetylglucosaminyltransferase [Orbilia oligospora]KAF3248240.1 N-acetylglucosaminyltransferase [Orbilia oligospora]KAF3250376.1 N-acetylglucosaminyltransferase [Orbilia oligospora]KAF3275673.1 N-acetylglucosaminyltransferase [Orbilia oligospora]